MCRMPCLGKSTLERMTVIAVNRLPALQRNCFGENARAGTSSPIHNTATSEDFCGVRARRSATRCSTVAPCCGWPERKSPIFQACGGVADAGGIRSHERSPPADAHNARGDADARETGTMYGNNQADERAATRLRRAQSPRGRA